MWKRYSRRGSPRGFVGRGGSRPERVWASLASRWAFSSVTATTAQVLISLEMPTDLSALTNDPPEAMTLLRIVGSFRIANAAAAGAASGYTLALLVQDQTWTPSAVFATDADKRILWSRTFFLGSTESYSPFIWTNGTAIVPYHPEVTRVDIAPKVKVEPGKALFLVIYENSASTSEITVASSDMRVLYQRSGRRR